MKNHDRKAMAQVFFKSYGNNGALTKTDSPMPHSPSPSGEERPLKVHKLEKASSKSDLKKKTARTTFQNQQPLTKYIIGGKEAGGPYREFGYNKTESITTQILAGLRTR